MAGYKNVDIKEGGDGRNFLGGGVYFISAGRQGNRPTNGIPSKTTTESDRTGVATGRFGLASVKSFRSKIRPDDDTI